MAYVSQEMKAKLAPTIKAICKKYNVKASIAVRHHSTLVLNIKEGKIDFIGNYNTTCERIPRPEHLPFQPADRSIQVNTYWAHEHFSGKAKEFLIEAIDALKGPDFFDHSDAQTDYFHRSHYVDINIGKWDKPYEHVA
jgi:hypothetical protein